MGPFSHELQPDKVSRCPIGRPARSGGQGRRSRRPFSRYASPKAYKPRRVRSYPAPYGVAAPPSRVQSRPMPERVMSVLGAMGLATRLPSSKASGRAVGEGGDAFGLFPFHFQYADDPERRRCVDLLVVHQHFRRRRPCQVLIGLVGPDKAMDRSYGAAPAKQSK